MKYVPREITEEVNITPVHPLVNFAHLLGTVAAAGVVIYVLLGIIAAQLVQRIGPETEEKIGATLVQSLSMDTITDDSRIDYLTDLTTEIQADIAETSIGPATYPPVKIGILDTPVENAMVTAGSYLFVTEGLLDSIESENELAFVLAHELGHLHHRDPVTALGRSLVWLTISGLLGFGQQTTSIVPNAFNLAELRHSRGQETAADDHAVTLIRARYEHGAHSLDFFKRIESETPDLGALDHMMEWQHTHPLSSDRIERIEATFKTNSWPLTGEPTPLPENLQCPNFDPC
ncbi:MAG: M48 family metallopeptidase [Cyanobacteria bacterium J06614_10]